MVPRSIFALPIAFATSLAMPALAQTPSGGNATTAPATRASISSLRASRDDPRRRRRCALQRSVRGATERSQ